MVRLLLSIAGVGIVSYYLVNKSVDDLVGDTIGLGEKIFNAISLAFQDDIAVPFEKTSPPEPKKEEKAVRDSKEEAAPIRRTDSDEPSKAFFGRCERGGIVSYDDSGKIACN